MEKNRCMQLYTFNERKIYLTLQDMRTAPRSSEAVVPSSRTLTRPRHSKCSSTMSRRRVMVLKSSTCHTMHAVCMDRAYCSSIAVHVGRSWHLLLAVVQASMLLHQGKTSIV